MKISVIGGGPGGLYFSILAKKANPEFQIDVYERHKADDAFGFGVVFSDETLSEFLSRDPKSYELIRSRFAYWDDLDIARDGQKYVLQEMDSVAVPEKHYCSYCSKDAGKKALFYILNMQ